jgi:membrane-associated phospholipid phosphatase
MNDRSRTVKSRFLIGTLVYALLLTAGYFIFVSTPWGHQFDDDAFFGRKTLSRKIISLDSEILGLVNNASLLLAAVVLLVITVVRRCTFVGVIAVAGFGCAVVGAEVLKNVLPWQAQVPEDALLESDLQSNNYPSGHATIAASFALGLLLVSSPRWRPWLAIAGGCISAIFTTGVLFVGWHRPSDALGALAWSGLCMSLVAAFIIRVRGRPRLAIAHSGHAAFASIALAILVAIASWLFTAAAASEYPCGDLPFLVLTGLIITAAFSLTSWYGWQLRAVDWLPPESPERL